MTMNLDQIKTELPDCPCCGARPNFAIKRHLWKNGPTCEIWCYCLQATVVESSCEAAVLAWNQLAAEKPVSGKTTRRQRHQRVAGAGRKPAAGPRP
jgi:hypothetical protein